MCWGCNLSLHFQHSLHKATSQHLCLTPQTCLLVLQAAHCVKVFSEEGQLLYEIGSKGSREGQLKGPKGLAIDKRKNLVVCDNEKSRLQIFSLDGKFLNSVAEEMKDPWSVAVAKNGDLLVCDFAEDCIHIMN